MEKTTPGLFQILGRQERVSSSERYFSEFELFLKVGISYGTKMN